jgi:hypothetical protein
MNLRAGTGPALSHMIGNIISLIKGKIIKI